MDANGGAQLFQQGLPLNSLTCAIKPQGAETSPESPLSARIGAVHSPSFNPHSLAMSLAASPEAELYSKMSLANSVAYPQSSLSAICPATETNFRSPSENVVQLQSIIQEQVTKLNMATSVILGMSGRMDETSLKMAEMETKLAGAETQRQTLIAACSHVANRIQRLEGFETAAKKAEDERRSLVTALQSLMGRVEKLEEGGKEPHVNQEDRQSSCGGEEAKPAVETLSTKPAARVERKKSGTPSSPKRLRFNKDVHRELEDVLGTLGMIVIEEAGSRFVQKKLQDVNTAKEDKTAVLEELLPFTLTLSRHQYGNFVMQELLQNCTEQEALKIGEMLKGNVAELSTQMYGCRVIQRALTVLPEEIRKSFAKEIDGLVMRMVFNPHGNYVLLKLVEVLSPQDIPFVLDPLKSKIPMLAIHQFGCRIVNRLLQKCDEQDVSHIVDEVQNNLLRMCENEYGNFVVQQALKYGPKPEVDKMVAIIKSRLLSLSCDKYASVVVEKAYMLSDAKVKKAFCKQLLDLDEPMLVHVMNDQYGNFVTQKIMRASVKKQLGDFQKALQPFKKELTGNYYGQSVLNTLTELGFAVQ